MINNYCDWTERANENGSVTWKCSNKTAEKTDKHGRAYCIEHRIKVDQINKSRHKNCINKNKIINRLFDGDYHVDEDNEYSDAVEFYAGKLIYLINKGNFDNE